MQMYAIRPHLAIFLVVFQFVCLGRYLQFKDQSNLRFFLNYYYNSKSKDDDCENDVSNDFPSFYNTISLIPIYLFVILS